MKIKYQLKRLVKGLIDKKNVTYFISGGALGVDMWAMEVKEEYPNIKLSVPQSS